MKRASWLVALEQLNYLFIWSRACLSIDKEWLWKIKQVSVDQGFWDFSKERKEVEDLFLWKTPPGGLHAGQLYGGHRHHSQGVWGSLHPGEEYNGKIPPTALWTGLSFPFLSTIFFTYFQWQVWAADDYEIFKRMMIQKNIDLQMEALELLQQRFTLIPTSNPTQSSKSILLARIHSQSLKSILHSPEFQVWSPSWVPPTFKRVCSGSSGRGGQGDAGGDQVGARLNPFQQPHVCWQNSQSTKVKDIESVLWIMQ